ncbi:uncharacterized protein LOC117295077, partial [Asterias rubens]|uniref:uncharacterized protein LOC117295077 n=1 Tax=Asterias rubens TaxID=7604 RepID=UPI00145515B7
MAGECGRSYLLLLVGLLGLFVWDTQGQSCTTKAECEPNVVCELVTWFCNGSTPVATTAAPTVDPLTLPCCQHLGSCGDDVIVAGWVAVRNTSVTIDNVDYSVEWLDTFITEGNATLPAVIKSAYVGSLSTLRKVAMEFPSQMFVAEPTNSCTVDGEPKWPEWYQVTINVMADLNMDSTLVIEERREKECLCDVVYDCVNSACQVKSDNFTNNAADLGQVDSALAEDVDLFCVEPLNATNYTASSYFAVGFEPGNAGLDTWEFNASVEAGWAPELDDNDMWIKIHLLEDMKVSGLIIQGVGLNAERRVDQFKLEYEASDGSGVIEGSKIFNAGSRLDTKLTNYFPAPVKANAIKISVVEPCDPYYVGLRVQLIGCPVCASDPDCTRDINGICLSAENFCTYHASETTTVAAGPTTTASVTSPVATTSPTFIVPIVNKIDEVTASLDEEVKESLTTLILPADLSEGVASSAHINITTDVIKSGLDVIRNITTVANTTENKELQRKILEGSWNFMIAVSENEDSFVSENNELDEDLLQDFLAVGSLVLDSDREEAWKDIQMETVAGPLGIVSSIETVAIEVGIALIDHGNASDIVVAEDNLNGVIALRGKAEVKDSGYSTTFDSKDDSSGVATEITIANTQFEENGAIKALPANSSLVVVVLKFNSIEELLVKEDVEDQTPGNKRLASSVLSIQVVADGKPQSVPLSFKLGHLEPTKEEKPKCNFWEPVLSSDGDSSKTAGNWSDAGCTKDALASSTHATVCNCDHMTNFGILMWLGDSPPKDTTALDTISQVGCYVSIAALIVALGLLLYLKSSLSSERIIIHIHLMSVTLVALTIFVLGIGATDNEVLCKVITIALHFFFMSMFSWMLVEGIHLYRQVISVFESEKSRLWVYFAVGWGIPVVVVIIGTSIFISDYGVNTTACWLNPADSIWVFMGPIIPTIAVNLVVLIMVSR